jgi:hypothetical protein
MRNTFFKTLANNNDKKQNAAAPLVCMALVFRVLETIHMVQGNR